MMWFDEDGADPDYPPPYLEQWDEGSCYSISITCPSWRSIPRKCSITCATTGTWAQHTVALRYFENEMRDHVLIQRQGGAMTLYGGAMLYTTTWYTGPGVLLSKQVWGDATQFEMIANTPSAMARSRHGMVVGEISDRHDHA